MAIIRLVLESVTFGLSLECFPVVFGQFFTTFEFSEKIVFSSPVTLGSVVFDVWWQIISFF